MNIWAFCLVYFRSAIPARKTEYLLIIRTYHYEFPLSTLALRHDGNISFKKYDDVT